MPMEFLLQKREQAVIISDHSCDESQIVFAENSVIIRKGGLTQDDNAKTQKV